MSQDAVKLGQRVYKVTNAGEIKPTLVSRVAKARGDISYDAHSIEQRWYGVPQKYGYTEYLILDPALEHERVYLTFDEACDRAIRVLREITESGRDEVDRLRRLVMEKEEVRAEIDGVREFKSTQTGIDILLGDLADTYMQSDFPEEYFEPGRHVWIADTDAWQHVQAVVTVVRFSPNNAGSLLYVYRYGQGSHSGTSADCVCSAKERALRFLGQQFNKKLPGTFDRKRVNVVMLGEAEPHVNT